MDNIAGWGRPYFWPSPCHIKCNLHRQHPFGGGSNSGNNSQLYICPCEPDNKKSSIFVQLHLCTWHMFTSIQTLQIRAPSACCIDVEDFNCYTSHPTVINFSRLDLVQTEQKSFGDCWNWNPVKLYDTPEEYITWIVLHVNHKWIHLIVGLK